MKTKIKLLIILSFLFLYAGNIKAQSERDSMNNLLKEHPQEDTIRVNLLLETAFSCWHHVILSQPYIKEAVAGSVDQIPEYNTIRNSGHKGGDFIFKRVK